MIEAGFNYLIQSKLYIWKRQKKNQDKIKSGEPEGEVVTQNMNRDTVRLGGNKLRDLAWSLDVLDLNKHQNEL